MEEMNIENLATLIAKMLKEIKNAELEKVILQNKLDTLSKETSSLKNDLNKLDERIASKKYEISNKLSDTSKLILIKNNE